jgi:glucose uptake protein GlcU
MKQNMDLKEIKHKAYRAIRQDGLDTVAGGIFLAFAAIFFIDIRFAGLLGLGTVIFVIMPEALRRKITYPRIGYAKFLQPKGITNYLLIAFLVVICLVLFYLFGKVAKFNWLMPLYLSIVFSGIAFISARKRRTWIDYALIILFLSSGITGILFTMSNHDPGWVTAYQLWSLALILITIGVVQFFNFLHKYPEPKKEVLNAR